MLRIILHVSLLPIMLWIEHRSPSRFTPARAAAAWYLLGLPLILAEALAFGQAWKMLAIQSAAAALFFLPPAYAAFWVGARRPGLFLSVLAFLILSCPMALIAGLALARTSLAFGGV